ncbi:Tryptase beta-2 [Zancudomyces culisetae]|uniref:Tryptase beta-2 n=1 Tax=Zancudomyces culisetae TaxID=1213189 RepID=A0A1R1PD50_ZANCU|nr:Tryptase beta-2 [Zancudomyces culisetae]|eukprot:OMH78886.1 Tryptase beta-2 [Zancudomyces culisetae]
MKSFSILNLGTLALGAAVVKAAIQMSDLILYDSEEIDNASLVTNIINGVEVESDEFGFASQIFFKSDSTYYFSCTGSLISPSYVVTAGHCVIQSGMNITTDTLAVVVGSRILGNPNNGTDYYNVVKINSGDYSTVKANDIALLKLEKPVPSSVAKPVKLYPYRVNNDLSVQVAGWGVFNTSEPMPSMGLLKTTVDISSSSNCTAYKSAWKSNFGPLICQESYNGNDSCQGDSGGPLVTKINGEQVLVGVTSTGGIKETNSTRKCGYNSIAYYARTSYFLQFIAKELGVPIRDLIYTAD